MATTTHLRAELRRRAPRGRELSEAIQDATWEIAAPIVGDYWNAPESDQREPNWYGVDWLKTMEKAVRRAAREAIVAAVIPAMVDVIVEHLPDAPAAAVEHSEQLRADLATLRA